MNRDFLLHRLSKIKNAKREYRDACAKEILDSHDLFILLVYETFNTDEILSIKASWILEWICNYYNLHLIVPHLDFFTQNLELLKYDGSKRSCAKICEQLAKVYHTNNSFKNQISSKQIERIIETNFDWLITNQPIAVKAYALTTLYYFGFYSNWVHFELEKIISTTINTESKAFKARGKKILKLLQKSTK